MDHQDRTDNVTPETGPTDHSAPHTHSDAGAAEQETTSNSGRFEDYTSGFRFSVQSARAAVCDLGRQVEDGIMTLLPVDVTKHLLNSQKELVRAGQRFVEITSDRTRGYGERIVESLDRKATRAEDLHTRAEQEKAERRAADSAQL